MTGTISAAVEPLNDGARWQYMLALGRRAAADPAVRDAVAALARSPNFYQRRLAMMATAASGNEGIILDTLRGPSVQLAGFACRLAALNVGDDAIARVLPELARSRRRRLVRAVAAAHRTAPLDRTFERLLLDDRCEFGGYAHADISRSQLADRDFADMLSPSDWARLASRQPDIAVPALTARVTDGDEPPWYVAQAIGLAIGRTVSASPRTALEMLRQAATTIPLSRLPFARVADRFPAEIAELLLADRGERVPQLEPRLLRRLDAETSRALIARGAVVLSPRCFRRLTPAARQNLYAQGALEASRDQAGVLDAGYVELLPKTERVAEARRAWTAPRNLASPERRLPYLAFLPFDEAKQLADEFISQPDADLRSMAGAAVIATARYERDRMSDALAFVRYRKNDQDPVRLALINALAGLPGRRWSDAHLAEISDIIAEALAARDCSAATMSAAASWLIGLAPFRIEFVAREVSRLAERLGHVPSVDLESRISDAQMPALTAHLLPLLETWQARDYTGSILGLLGNFGRRLRAAPRLLDLVERMTGDKRRYVAEGALHILSRVHAGDRLALLVPKLLAEDPSWILSSTVAEHISRKRQDLLGEFLSPRVFLGRFSTNEAAAVPGFVRGFQRWSEQQQTRYAQSLLAIATGSQRSAWELRSCLLVLTRMPAIDIAPIERLAGLATVDTALRDMAVMALGRLDDARGLPSLTAALEDDRARVAIYALRRILLQQQPDAAVRLLRQAPLQKVTVAKEVVRLAGDLEGDSAFRFLGEFISKRDLHKDVRIAVMRALWSHLERNETWDLFAEAARGDPAAALATVRVPQERMSGRTRARLAGHMALLVSHQDPRVRRETLRRLVGNPVTVEGTDLTERLQATLGTDNEDEASLAAAALVLCSRSDYCSLLADQFAALESPRTLQAVIAGLIERAPFQGNRVHPVAERLIDLLLARGKQTGLTMRLAVNVLSAEAMHRAVQRASSVGSFHPGALIEVLAALRTAARQRRGADIEALEGAFAGSNDPSLRRIGLAILVERAAVVGWTDATRQRLAAHRDDPDALVKEAASLTFPPDMPATDQN